MNVLGSYLKNYTLCAVLFFYGLFYHISSSEFWPVTISKTWFTPDQFEYSMLQKPLFSVFLSLFHLPPLSDSMHLYVVKAVFSIFGVLCLFLISKIAAIISETKFSPFLFSLVIVITLIISPTLLNNFFRIRSDQASILFFLLFSYFILLEQYKKSIVFAILTLLISVKSLIFLPFIILLAAKKTKDSTFMKQLSKFNLIVISLVFLASIIWLINFNIPALYYLTEIYSHTTYPSFWLLHFTKLEFTSLALLLISYLYLFKKNPHSTLISVSSLLALLLIIVIPQNYPFFIASLSPILYMPLLVMLLIIYNKKQFKYLILASVLVLLNFTINPNRIIYSTNKHQMEYISLVSKLLKQNNLSYLDGVGLFPRQKTVTCFVSPSDEAANFGCRNKILRAIPDVIIHTGRLASELGVDISGLTSESYKNDIPFLYLKKSSQLALQEKTKPLLSSGEFIPLLLFQFN